MPAMRRAACLSLVLLACKPQTAGVAGPQGAEEKTVREDAELAFGGLRPRCPADAQHTPPTLAGAETTSARVRTA